MSIQSINPETGMITTHDGKQYPLDVIQDPRSADDPNITAIKREYDEINSAGGSSFVGKIHSALTTPIEPIDPFAVKPATVLAPFKAIGRAIPQGTGSTFAPPVPADTTPAAQIVAPQKPETPPTEETPPQQTPEMPTVADRPAIPRPSQPQTRSPSAFEQLEQQRGIASRDIARSEATAMEEDATNDAIVAQARNDRVAEIERQKQDFAKIQAEKQQEVAAETAKLGELEKDFLATKIKNPWQSQSTGKTIVQAIAVALGQFAATRGGGTNTAYTIIQDAINKDLQVQEANLQRKGAVLANARGALARTREKYENREVALKAADAISHAAVIETIQSIKDSGISKQKQILAQALIDRENLAQIDRKEQILAAQEAEKRSASATGMSAQREQADRDWQTFRQQQGFTTPEDITREKTWANTLSIGGKQYWAQKPEQAQGYKEGLLAVTTFINKIDELDAYLARSNPALQLGRVLREGPEAAEARVALEVAAQARPKIYDPTSVNRESEIKMAERALGDPIAALDIRRSRVKLQAERRAALERVAEYKNNLLEVRGGRETGKKTQAMIRY